MATAKQIAWRKKFAEMAKSGKFTKAKSKTAGRAAAKKSPRKVNPVTPKPKRKLAPTKRRVAVVRRRSNPVLPYTIKMGTAKVQRVVARCETAEGAKAYARQLKRSHPASHISVFKD